MCAHHVIYPIGYLNDVSYYFNRARTHTPIFVIALFLYYLLLERGKEVSNMAFIPNK